MLANAGTVAHEAHRIKGASGLVSATVMAACVGQHIEAAARLHALENAHIDVDMLAAELDRVAITHTATSTIEQA